MSQNQTHDNQFDVEDDFGKRYTVVRVGAPGLTIHSFGRADMTSGQDAMRTTCGHIVHWVSGDEYLIKEPYTKLRRVR